MRNSLLAAAAAAELLYGTAASASAWTPPSRLRVVQQDTAGTTRVFSNIQTAIDDFAADQVAAGEDLTGKRPEAWFVEASWSATDRLTLAARYEASDDYQGDARRAGATVAYGLCDYAQIAGEYLLDDTDDDNPVHVFTVQLAIEF